MSQKMWPAMLLVTLVVTPATMARAQTNPWYIPPQPSYQPHTVIQGYASTPTGALPQTSPYSTQLGLGAGYSGQYGSAATAAPVQGIQQWGTQQQGYGSVQANPSISSGTASQPIYQQQPVYQQQPIYQQQPAYQQQPVYQQQPNGTDGNVRIAVDAIKAAQAPHHFLSVTKAGHSAIVSTRGNEDCHAILRGGKAPNYDAASVDAACKDLAAGGVPAKVMVDFSHANSRKQHRLQIEVAADVAAQMGEGEERIIGVMVESHLKEGRQDVKPGCTLEYGMSITDACIGWDDSVGVLDTLAEGVRQRRIKRAREFE